MIASRVWRTTLFLLTAGSAVTGVACSGQETNAGTGGRTPSDATAGQGGTSPGAGGAGADDASTNRGGWPGTGGCGVRGDRCGPNVDASDEHDATDASQEQTRPGVASDATDEIVDAPVRVGFDGAPCPTPGPDGVVHVPFYSFDFDTVDSGPRDWRILSASGSIVWSADDSAGASAATPGSLHATFFAIGNGGVVAIERQYDYTYAQDFSCFTRMHSSIKFASGVSDVRTLSVYVHVVVPDLRPWTAGTTNPVLDDDGVRPLSPLGDGGWHELVTYLDGPQRPYASITNVGFQFVARSVATPPDPEAGVDAGADGADLPTPIDVYIDNIWFE